MRWTMFLVALVVGLVVGELHEAHGQSCTGGSYGYGYAPQQTYYSPPAYSGYYNPAPVFPSYYASPFEYGGCYGGVCPQPQAFNVPRYYPPNPYATYAGYPQAYAPQTRQRGVAVYGFRSR